MKQLTATLEKTDIDQETLMNSTRPKPKPMSTINQPFTRVYKAAVYDPDALHFWSRNNTNVIVWACIIIDGIGEIVGDAIQQQYAAR